MGRGMRIVLAVVAAWLVMLAATRMLGLPAPFAAVAAVVIGVLVWLLARPRERSDAR